MPNAIDMLREDHRKMKELFHRFERAEEDDRKEEIADETLEELKVHTALEEEIFYPAAREQIDEKKRVAEAFEEHHVAKILLSELKKISSHDQRFEAKYKVLAESVKRHIQEEESKLFPMLEDSLNADELGQEMEERKEKLEQEPFKRSESRAGARANARRTAGRKRRRRAAGRR
jgi:hemerythrin-like domain-containing protein